MKRRYSEERIHEPSTSSADSLTILATNNLVPQYVPPPGSRYAHRWKLTGRARVNNAADTPYFSHRKALVYHFLDVYDAEVDGTGSLKSCTLHCGLCAGGTWHWQKNGKSKGSTTNMNTHMNDKHRTVWEAGIQSDRDAWGVLPAAKLDDSVLDEPLSTTPPAFDIDELHKRFTRWFVKRNQPFTELESETFRDILLFLRPSLNGQIDHWVEFKGDVVTRNPTNNQDIIS